MARLIVINGPLGIGRTTIQAGMPMTTPLTLHLDLDHA